MGDQSPTIPSNLARRAALRQPAPARAAGPTFGMPYARFRAFLSTATGCGTVGVRAGKPFFDVKAGKVDVREIEYVAARPRPAGKA
jgi:hypothetical protein